MLGRSALLAATATQVLWTPAAISTALWLDAADSSTVTTATGGISQWNDKSGNANNATQATSGVRPDYNSEQQNSLATITYASGDFLTLPIISWAGSAFTWYFALKTTINTSATFPALISENSGTSNGYLQMGGGDPASPPIAISRTGQATSSTSTAMPKSTFGIVSFQSTGISSGTITVTPYVNAAATSPATLSLGSLQTAATSATIGASKAGSADKYSGLIGEIIYASSNHSQSVREQVEGYLAHKWGLTSSLPSNHPYKTIPPYV